MPCILATRLLGDPSPIVRGAAVWALSQLIDKREFDALTTRHEANELDPSVRDEWAAAKQVEAVLA